MNKSKSLFKFLSVLIFASGLIITACKKEEIKGPKGDPGTPGGGGNSNITSTNVFVVTSSQWQVDSICECLKVTIDFPALTKEVVANGGVKVYIQMGTVWADLPFVNGDLFTQFGFDEGHLYLNYINIEGGIATAPATANYRMVILKEG